MSKPEQPPIYLIRKGSSLYGEMNLDREWIEGFPQGERIKVDLRTGRVPSRLRFYWAFLSKVVKATDCSPSPEALHSLIKLETGHTTPIKVKGYTVLVPASIAFDSMSEAEFSAFLEKAIEFIASTYGITTESAFGTAALPGPGNESIKEHGMSSYHYGFDRPVRLLNCPRCKQRVLNPNSYGESSLYGSFHRLCMPCWDAEDAEINREGTNNLPETLKGYGPENDYE